MNDFSISNILIDPPEVRGTSVLLDLTHKDKRNYDILSSSDICTHLSKKNDKCQTCGAFIGFFGEEKSPNDYYRHVMMLVNTLQSADDVFLLTKRYLPEDYKLPFFTQSSPQAFKHQKTYTLYNRIVTDPRSRCRVSSFYVCHFTNDIERLWKPDILLSKRLSIFDFISGKVLCINPKDSDLDLNQPNVSCLSDRTMVRRTLFG